MPASLVLAYPNLHSTPPPQSDALRAALTEGPLDFFTPAVMRDINLNYAGSEAVFDDVYAYPGNGDVSGLPPVPVGGPAVTPLQAAAGVGYGEGFAANSHRFAPGGMLAAVKYLVEELHVDVNAYDHEGNTALHHAAARGDVEMIQYLVSKGADVKAVTREGKTTADMANGPVQRIQPFPEAVALLEKLGSKNNHKCVSC